MNAASPCISTGTTARRVGVAAVALLGAHDPLDHGVDGLEVARVGRQREVDLAAVGGVAVVRIAEVILHVAVALDRPPAASVPSNSARITRSGLREDVGEDVEAAAMGHAHDHLVRVEARRLLDEGVEQRDQRLASLEREALLARDTSPGGTARTTRRRRVARAAPAGRRASGRDGCGATRCAPAASRAAPCRRAPGTRRRACRSRSRRAPPRARGAGRGSPPRNGSQSTTRSRSRASKPSSSSCRSGWITWAVTERIEVGDEVAELAVGVDELGDLGRPRRSAGATAREIVAREEQSPAVVDGGGIALPVSVERFHVRRIRANDLVEGQHGVLKPLPVQSTRPPPSVWSR